MKKFIILYHAPPEVLAQSANSTPEEMAKGMEPWMQWAAKCGDGLIDLGTPLVGGQKLSGDGTSQPSKREVAGYSILQAENMEAVHSLLEGHPHLGWNAGCEIEIHESMPLSN